MGGTACNSCKHTNEQTNEPTTIRVWFNKRKNINRPERESSKDEESGPQVEKYCNKCGTLTMQTYFTAQLRSADEGQTVFYRCVKCLIQTSENS